MSAKEVPGKHEYMSTGNMNTVDVDNIIVHSEGVEPTLKDIVSNYIILKLFLCLFMYVVDLFYFAIYI